MSVSLNCVPFRVQGQYPQPSRPLRVVMLVLAAFAAGNISRPCELLHSRTRAACNPGAFLERGLGTVSCTSQ